MFLQQQEGQRPGREAGSHFLTGCCRFHLFPRPERPAVLGALSTLATSLGLGFSVVQIAFLDVGFN